MNDLGSQLDETAGAFMDTDAVMRSLYLIMTADTALAQLAGRWACRSGWRCRLPPEWHWLLQREDSPWYPTMRLFRQTEQGQWQGVFERMARGGKMLAAGGGTAR